MFLIGVLSFLLASGVVQDSTATTGGEVYFRWNKYRYEASYMNNAEAAKGIRKILEEIGFNKIDSVNVTAYASPEGVYEHNQMLSRKRAREFDLVVKEEIGLAGGEMPVNVRSGGEAWDLLRERVAKDESASETARERVLTLLDDTKIGWDTKKWRIENGWLGRTREEGDLREWLYRNHFRYLRSLVVDIFAANVQFELGSEQIGSKEEMEEKRKVEETVVDADVKRAKAILARTNEQLRATLEGMDVESIDSIVVLAYSQKKDGTMEVKRERILVDGPKVKMKMRVNPDDFYKNLKKMTFNIYLKPGKTAEKDMTAAKDTASMPQRLSPVEPQDTLRTRDSLRVPTPEERGIASGEEGVKLPTYPVLGISTNLLYDATYIPGYGFTSIPSLSVEYYPVGGNVTFGADVEWPNWKHADEHRYFQVHNITLWGRYYFKPEEYRFNGWYVGGSANAAQFGVGWNKKGWEGEGLGISVLGGHKWTFGRIYIDMGLSLGVFYSRFDSYTWGNDATKWYYYDYVGDPEKFKPRSKRWLWMGPTRLQVSIGVDLFNRNRKKSK